jgi:nucleoside phosphorylase
MIGIVTILAEEYAAVCEVLGCHQEEFASGGSGTRKYKLGVVWQPSGKSGTIVAVAQLIIAGTTDSAVIANNFLHDCPNIREIIVCGIAGAVPNPTKAEDHVRFGDIVVSGMEGVLQYDFGKAIPSGFEVRGPRYIPSPSLIQSARALQSDEKRGLRPWESVGYIHIQLVLFRGY